MAGDFEAFDPVADEIRLIRLLEELRCRRSNVATNRFRIEELVRETFSLEEQMLTEQQRAKRAEQGAWEARITIKRHRESRLRYLQSSKMTGVDLRSKTKQGLLSAQHDLHELQAHKMALEGKVRDLQEQVERLMMLKWRNPSSSDELQSAFQSVMYNLEEVAKRQYELVPNAEAALKRQRTLQRQRGRWLERVELLLFQNATLKHMFQTSTSELAYLNNSDNLAEQQKPHPSFLQNVFERLQSDIESYRRDYETIRIIVISAKSSEVSTQTKN